MKIISGHFGGISLRDSPQQGNAYYYKVCQDGTYGFIHFDKFGGQPDEMLSGTANINVGLNQQNTIAVVANGNHYDFYVNKVKIDRYEDGNYGQRSLGVSASGDSKVLYTNAKVWGL